MEANGIEVDDLYNFVLPNEDKWQLPSNVHFNSTGYKALAEQVAKTIEADLPKK
jgi:lysophospholipase L1-like esterase